MSPMAFKILYNAVSNVGCTATFNPKTCYLVDYNLQILDAGRKEMFYLTMHTTHFIYSYMVSYIW